MKLWGEIAGGIKESWKQVGMNGNDKSTLYKVKLINISFKLLFKRKIDNI